MLYVNTEKYIEDVNAKNTEPTTPDYYEQADKKIEAVKV